mgnify:FL=1
MVKLFVVTVEDEFLIADAYLRAFFDGFRDKRVTTDHNTLFDDGLSAEDGSTGVDRDVVPDGRMTAHIPKLLSALGGERAECYTLIELDMAADDGCFTDHDAGTVVNKEIFADGCTRMDVDTGFADE